MLFGWSMGGAICLQTADLSRHHHLIRAMVLDAPVINWVNVLAHHAQLNRIPSAVGRYGQLMMSHPLGRRLTGLAAPVDLKSMDWVSRAVELRTPTLILHSVDDEYVPYGPSAALAEKNPEMVTFETFHGRPAHQGMERRSGALGRPGHARGCGGSWPRGPTRASAPGEPR